MKKIEAPVPANESERLEALQSYDLLDTLPEKEFDRITELASIICGTPIALVSLLDTNRQWFKSKYGLSVDETPRDISFCQHAVMGDKLFEIKNAPEDSRFTDNPLVTGSLNIQFYAGYPLMDPNGYALGTLCVIDQKPRELNADQKRALELLGGEVVTQILARKQQTKLTYFSYLIDYSIDMICVAGTDGYFKQVNSAFTKTLGWSEEELLSKPFLDFFHPDDIDSTQEEIGKLAAGQPTLSFQNRIRTTNGDYRIVNWVANPDTKTGNLFAIARDVTEAVAKDKALEASIQESRDIRYALDESAIVAVTDNQGIITFVNDQFCAISGYSREELIGQDHRIVNSGFHPREFMTKLWKTIAKGEIFRAEIQNKKKTGEYYWVDTTIVPLLDKNKKPQQYIAIRQDITDRKQSELLLRESEVKHRAFFENTLAYMYKHDLEGRILNLNKASAAALGYPLEELIGQKISNYFAPSSQADFEVYLNTIRAERKASGIITLANSKGEEVIWEFNNVLVEYETGQQVVMCSSIDITERYRLSEQLKRATESALSSLKAKDMFLANMSHEIRTPMNAIIGFSEVLSASNLDKEQLDFVNAIKVSGENLMVIINDILDFSKIESGHLNLEKVDVNIRNVLNGVKKQMNVKASEKLNKLMFFTENDIPEFVIADPVRLNQILINLVGNAIKFTENGKVEVFSNVIESNKDTCVVEFVIKDNGIGIASEKLETIFERFRQADDNTTRKYGGTGLGLSITRKLVDLFGGTLKVESKPGEGSSFYVSIPFVKSDSGPKVTQQVQSGTHDPDRKIHVLLAEDNELNQKLALKILSSSGITADVASNGKIATDILRDHVYDVVLMDLQMPEMDGYVATSYIRKVLKNQVPIIAMTAHSLVGEQEKCYEIGMTDYLSKPYKAQDLIAKIERAVNNKIESDAQHFEVLPPTNEFYDLTDLKMLSGGDDVFVTESLKIFSRNIQADIDLMSSAIEKQNTNAVSRLAHKMKSSYLIVGATRAVNICDQLENNKETSGSQLELLLGELTEITNTILKTIEN